jgi:Flp pilus assembly protein TadB
MSDAAVGILTFGGLGAGFATVAYMWRLIRLQRSAVTRLDDLLPEAEEAEQVEVSEARPFSRRHRALPWIVAAAGACALHFGFGWGWTLCGCFAAIAGLLGGQLEAYLAARRTSLIEVQLADAVDLMVGALQAGSGVTNALENALRESRTPLRQQLEEVLGRVRLGDDPQFVLRSLVARIPLETFRLFASVLSVHWEVGGSLAPTLATVGRQIRDRIELSRRLRSLTVQSRASTVAVLATTYFIALAMWRNSPDRVEEFVKSSFGQACVAGAAVLQAIGIVASSAMSRLKY